MSKRAKYAARVAAVLVIALSPVTDVPEARSQTQHDLIHKEFVELVKVMNKDQQFHCERVGFDRSGCFFFSLTAQRQSIWQFTSDTAMKGGSAFELCARIADALLVPGKEVLTSVSGMLNEPLRTSLLCTLKYVRTDHGKR